MELNLRPMTEAERLYCYGQSQQIMAQTGCVGHLRADMDTDGRGFFSSWDDHIGYLKTQEFKDEFEVVIDSLRFDSGVLANRTAVQKFCAATRRRRLRRIGRTTASARIRSSTPICSA